MARRIVTAREQHEMLSPWRTAEQMSLPGMPESQPVDKPQTETLYRGVRISPNLEPGLEDTAFSLYGRPGEGGDLFGNSSMRMGPTHDPGHGTPEDARHIIDWLNSPGRLKYHHNLPGWEGEEEGKAAKPRGYGLGPHWTTDRETAEMAATLYPGNVGVVMEAEHPVGERVDPYTYTHQHEHPDEHETRLFPGAPLSIKRMHLYHPKLKSWHTHEFDQPLSYTAAVRLAAAFDPMAVTNRLKGEFHDWFDALPEHRLDELRNIEMHPFMDHHEDNPVSHWPTVERFLKDKYPEAHRGFMTGREDASMWLDDPNNDYESPMLEGDDEFGSLPPPEPYSSADHEKLGYDPQEVAAGMVLLHNRAHSGRQDSYLNTDKKRLVDIFNKRQQMQRNYEQRTGALEDQDHPAEGEGFDAWRNRLWDGVMNGKTFSPNAPGSHYRAMSDKEYQAGMQSGVFRPLIGDHLYVTDDPDRVTGGAYGARNGGHIVEFTPQPTHDIPSATIGNQLMEKGVTHIPLDAVRRVWSWNGTDHMPEVHRG